MADEDKQEQSEQPEEVAETPVEQKTDQEQAPAGEAPESEAKSESEAGEEQAPATEESGGATPNSEEVEFDEDMASALEGAEEAAGEGEVDVDAAIAEADPHFQKDLESLSGEDFSGVKIDDATASDEVDENQKVPSAFQSFINNLPQEIKTRYLMAGGLVLVALPLAFLAYSGNLLPSFKLPYVISMEEYTNKIYSYEVDGIQVPLFDDFQTSSHTIQLPRTVINLRSQDGSTSYGEFQLSLVLRDKALSAAIQAKQSEILDLIQRVLEQVSLQDLKSPVGKEKVKKVIRHRINSYLQGNVVLGVYYESVLVSQ